MMAKADCRLSDELRAQLAELLRDVKGQGNAARILGINSTTLKCAVAGLCIQPGTAALIEKKLAEREARRAGLGLVTTQHEGMADE